jgi:TatD DNase family protein
MTIAPATLVDAHCHVDLFPDPPALARLIAERRIHTIAVTNAPSVFSHTERLARDSQYLHAAVGLHPELVPTHGKELDAIWPALERTEFVGEIGLDYTITDRDVHTRQREVFTRILERCAQLGNKTITVHSRRAVADTIAVIGSGFPGRVILHWFTGTSRQLQQAISNGLYFSINVAMVHSQKGRDLIAAIPRNRMLTESDGPFVRMGPEPASPSSSQIVVAHLARHWGLSEAEVVQTLVRNMGIDQVPATQSSG